MYFVSLPYKRDNFQYLLIVFIFILIGSSTAQNANGPTHGYSLIHYTDGHSLPQNSIKDITQGSEGVVWLTTENGLARFDGCKFKIFNKSNINISCNRFLWFQPSINRMSGELFATTQYDEYVRIENGKAYSNSIYFNRYLSRILFRHGGHKKIAVPKSKQPDGEISIDNITVGSKPYPHTQDSLHLPFNPADIRISITIPYFGKPNNLNISYAVSGNGAIPERWIPLDDDKMISLSNLPSGTHTLHIKKQNDFGVNNYTNTLLTIIVQKAWYETIWFRVIVVLSLLAVLIIFNKLQNRNLLQKNRILEEAVDKRTESLKQTLQALKESENELGRQVRIQSQMIASLTHDVQSPLRAVTSISYAINAMINEGKYNLVAEIGKSIGDSTERISTMLDSTLDYIKVQLSQKNIQFEKVNLHDLVAQKILLFSLSSKKQDNKFVNNIPTELSVKNNPYLLGIIINNLVDNANKNTMHGIISIHCKSIHNKLVLTVSDTGYGIPDHLIQWLNLSEQDAPDKEQQYLKKVTGVGLIIVKEIARMMKLTLLAERNAKGSSVSIYLENF